MVLLTLVTVILIVCFWVSFIQMYRKRKKEARMIYYANRIDKFNQIMSITNFKEESK